LSSKAPAGNRRGMPGSQTQEKKKRREKLGRQPATETLKKKGEKKERRRRRKKKSRRPVRLPFAPNSRRTSEGRKKKKKGGEKKKNTRSCPLYHRESCRVFVRPPPAHTGKGKRKEEGKKEGGRGSGEEPLNGRAFPLLQTLPGKKQNPIDTCPHYTANAPTKTCIPSKEKKEEEKKEPFVILGFLHYASFPSVVRQIKTLPF